eukprot:8621986-Pyramimonas_sp.AAC.1
MGVVQTRSRKHLSGGDKMLARRSALIAAVSAVPPWHLSSVGISTVGHHTSDGVDAIKLFKHVTAIAEHSCPVSAIFLNDVLHSLVRALGVDWIRLD